MDAPLSRQPACHLCEHEHMWLDCEWCGCVAHLPPGIYPE